MGESRTREVRGPEAPTLLRAVIVASRILLLLLAAGALVAAVVIATRDSTRGNSEARYACPMHPEVRAPKPGECPICGMALEPIGRDSAASPKSHREIPGMPDLAAVENVRRHNIIDFVRKRSLIFSERELRGPAWVESDGDITAILYSDQIGALAADEPGSFTLTQTPQITFAVRRTAGPALPWDESTSRLRFQLDTGRTTEAEVSLLPGQVGWLELAPRSRQVLTVPASAVLQAPDGPYVLVPVGSFRFEKRPIEIGETFLKEGFAVVLSGVHVNERVVARATFFVDADRRTSSQANDAGWVTP